jgi:hypothetical protein
MSQSNTDLAEYTVSLEGGAGTTFHHDCLHLDAGITPVTELRHPLILYDGSFVWLPTITIELQVQWPNKEFLKTKLHGLGP